MSEPFIAEIRIFAGNFAPSGWAQCDGQILSIAQHQALFSLIGTTYGGDGQSTLALPDMRGRVPMHRGNGPGLSPRNLGEKAGNESVGLNGSNLPTHAHAVAIPASGSEGQMVDPDGHFLGAGEEPDKPYSPSSNTTLAAFNTSNAGLGTAVYNMQPYLCVNFIIALVGIYPTRP